MIRYNLTEVCQKDKKFYVLVADPREIAKLLTQYSAGEVQESQRPWLVNRVKEIALYVAGKRKEDGKKVMGLIPNAPIINMKKISLNKDDDGFYIMLPVTEEEIKGFEGTIEPIDGQHRIRAFMDEYIDVDFDEDIKYKMVFSTFFKLSEREKKELFMVTNEKQVKVPTNLLRLFRHELALLNPEDENIYKLVETLNSEDFSPLKERITIGANKVKKGYQESQISKILVKSGVYKILNKKCDGDKDIIAKIISNYLSAWETYYGVSFQNPANDTITKISGVRYIMYLLPTMIKVMENKKMTLSSDSFRKIIEDLPAATGVEDVFIDSSTKLSFQGEGSTITLAGIHVDMLEEYENKHDDDFNMLEGI